GLYPRALVAAAAGHSILELARGNRCHVCGRNPVIFPVAEIPVAGDPPTGESVRHMGAVVLCVARRRSMVCVLAVARERLGRAGPCRVSVRADADADGAYGPSEPAGTFHPAVFAWPLYPYPAAGTKCHRSVDAASRRGLLHQFLPDRDGAGGVRRMPDRSLPQDS